METKKKNLILFIIIILILTVTIASFCYWYYFVKQKYLTNIPGLYSSFTDHMKDEVNSHLKLLNCEPKEYYYDDSVVCLVCGKIHLCVEYGLVNREGKEKMNPKLPFFLKGECSKEEELNFYSENIAKLLSCKCNGECLCDDGIKPRAEEHMVIFTFPENVNIKQKIEETAEKAKAGKCEFIYVEHEEEAAKKTIEAGYKLIDGSFTCGTIKGITISNEVIFGITFVEL